MRVPILRKLTIGAGLALLVLGQNVMAEATATRLTQSVEGLVSASSDSVSQRLEKAPVTEASELLTGGSRLERVTQQRPLAHPAGQVFSIFDAQTVISLDDDDDGYYHRLRVSFDPDVDAGIAWVYAKLYLSLEGGPWNHYFTTDVFSIEDDLTGDAYEVVTRLLDGYPTGYYDVLIELYDADYDLLVVNYGPFEDRDLAVLPLEDIDRDSYHEHGGGGALGPVLLLLALLAVTKGYRVRQRGGKTAV
ncbi:MAG: choice-of-anchor H family protein [Candidatus Thiodiazotropha sp. (ex Notomyrtea botanica)]|nr:choice-of-anchor H family protein [Candidatus Thiodiazotropha sp. (ex Notomyrtea botanica)]